MVVCDLSDKGTFCPHFLRSFWLGLSNLLSIAALALVYGTVFKVQDFNTYVVYLGAVWSSGMESVRRLGLRQFIRVQSHACPQYKFAPFSMWKNGHFSYRHFFSRLAW